VYTFSVYKFFEFLENRENNLNVWKGKRFPALSFIDRDKNTVSLDFRSSDYTVIDFWYVGCPSCIIEMKDFDDLISKHSGKIKIYSFSVDKYKIWKKYTSSEETIKSKELKFLAKQTPFWIHLFPEENLNTGDNFMKKANEKFQVTRYPSYFILDRSGKIVFVTNNLKKFIALNVEGRSGYWLFLKNIKSWQYRKKALALFILVYPAFVIFLLLINQLMMRRKLVNKLN
jgi:hypothetical protein